MDLAILNKMIIEHLRHYGYQVAARIVESEIKANASRIVDKPSKLFDLATKPSQTPDPPIQHGEFLSISTKTGESSVKSGNKNFSALKNDSGTIDSEITSQNGSTRFKPEVKRSPKLTESAAYNENPDAKDLQSTFDKKSPNSSDISVRAHQPRASVNTKGSDDDRYQYGGSTSDHLNQARGRNFDPHSTKHAQSVRLPLLDAPRNHSTEFTPPLSQKKGGHNHHIPNHQIHQHESQNDEEEENSRKVRDPKDLNPFVPYSYNPQDHEKIIFNNPKGPRSISVPQRKEQFYEQENLREPSHEHRNPKPQPPSDHFIPRMTTPLKPISNPNPKIYLANKKIHDEELQLPRNLHPASLDYSILNREAELLPAAAEINARRGIPQRPAIKPVQPKQSPENFPAEPRETKVHKQFQVNTFPTPTKADKAELHVTIKEPSDPDHVPFQRPHDMSRALNTTNPLLKNINFDSSTDHPAQIGRNTHHKDNQDRRDNQSHNASHLSFERQSLIVFKPSPNAIDKPDSIKYSVTPNNKEMFAPTHNRIDFLQDFRDSMKQQQPKYNWAGKTPDGQNNYHLSDSFGAENWERSKQATQNQVYNPPISQHGSDKVSLRGERPEDKITHHTHNVQPVHRELSDREHAFDPFEHTLYSNKNRLPNSEQLVDMYGQDQQVQDSNSQQNQIHHNVDLNHKTLEYLKDTTKLTEKDIRESFNVYVQILNPNVNPELLMNREKFVEYMRKVRGITSPSFSETCFDFAIAAFTNERDTEYITFREVGHLLDLMHPEHPYAFMKLLFKLYQGEEKQVQIRDLEAPLRGISSGELYEISLILRSSLDYIYERLKTSEVKLSFEEYLGYMQDYEPMKIYG